MANESTTGAADLTPDLMLHANPGEALVGPLSFNQTVRGVTLALRASIFFTLNVTAPTPRVDARVVADLGDLQSKIGSLIDTISLPTDNCNHFGVDNIVARIWGKQLTVAAGGVATLTLHGDVDVWACVKNPVPCTKLEFDGLSPRLVTYDCNPPLKKRTLDQPFDATLPFTLSVPDTQTVAIALGQPTITLGGTAGALTDGILRIANVDVSTQVKQMLDSAIDPSTLRQALPAPLQQLGLAISGATLVSNHGALTAVITLGGNVAPAALGLLFQLFQGTP